MRKKCDVYLCARTHGGFLKAIKLFDKNFPLNVDVDYVGYLKVNIDRIKLISIIVDLRARNIACFSVPIEYRESASVSLENARERAVEYGRSIGAQGVSLAVSQTGSPPLYWVFDLLGNEGDAGRAGGVVMVDKIDGHVWTRLEYEEYMYDFNGIL